MSQHHSGFSMENAKHLAQTEAGQKLLALLQAQSPDALQTAMKQASSGDYDQLKRTLGVFMASSEAQALLKQLEKHAHE